MCITIIHVETSQNIKIFLQMFMDVKFTNKWPAPLLENFTFFFLKSQIIAILEDLQQVQRSRDIAQNLMTINLLYKQQCGLD